MSRRQTQQQSSGDLLWGVEEIADYIRRSKRQTYYLIENEMIPIKRVGPKMIVASRTEIDATLKSETT
jgi:hypothetical protein